MKEAIVPGFSVGHWTHPSGSTGCTVVLADRPAFAFRDIRGGAPGTRETDLLTPGALVRHVDAVLLTGGSAFGLAAAEGVVRWLHEHGRGFPTDVVPVPIVTAAVLFDLTGPAPIAPDAEAGYQACSAARPDAWYPGKVGVGTGTSVGKLFGRAHATPTQLGAATVLVRGGIIGALAAVNAVGEIVDPSSGEIRAGIRSAEGRWLPTREAILRGDQPRALLGTNTTLIVVATDLALDQHALIRMAIAAHDAIARTVRPAHTLFDGDTVFVLARQEQPSRPEDILTVSVATELAVEQAILSAVIDQTTVSHR